MDDSVEMQPAALKSPRNSCAIAVYRVVKKSDRMAARRAVAELIEMVNTPGNKSESCDVMVAIHPNLINDDCRQLKFEDPDLFPMQCGRTTFKEDQHDVIIQVAAMTRADCWFGLRLAKAQLSPTCEIVEEIFGGRLLLGQETFGFYHSDPQMGARPSAEKRRAIRDTIETAARIHQGDLVGGSWLMYQRYQQELNVFYDLSMNDKVQVMGGQFTREVEQTQLAECDPPSSCAHVKAMQGMPMVRRGFSYRHNGEEGTVFLALSNDIEKGFRNSLQCFVEQDKLSEFTKVVANALYFLPPSGRWLCEDVEVRPLPPEAEALLLRSTPESNPIALREYTTALAIPEYIALLKDYIFADAIGSQTLIPAIQSLVVAAHQVAAGGELEVAPQVSCSQDDAIRQDLDDLLTEALNKLNQYNGVAGAYVSGA